MKKREFKIEAVQNGFIIYSTYHFKPNDKDPGHPRVKRFVAKTNAELIRIISEQLKEPAVLVGEDD